MTAELSHAARAMRYAQAAAAGDIDVCKWVSLCYQRHLRDLKASRKKSYPYRWDGERLGGRVCKFVELLPHVKGKWAARRERIRLEDWQCGLLTCAFGWVRKDSGLRRYRRVVLLVPRKNSKSTTAAALGLYGFAADGHFDGAGSWVPEFGAEVYSGATTEYQALEVFRPAWQMAERTPAFREHYHVELGGTWKNPQAIFSTTTGARFHPLVGRPGDGASPSMAIVDEYHEHDTSGLLDTMQTGMGAREQPMLLVISTAGVNLESPCYALVREVQRVLDGVIEDDSLFGLIYTIDEGDDWTSEGALRKANPNWGVSLEPENILDLQRGAVNESRRQNTFRTKHLNIWCSARSAWMNMEWWHRQADTSLSLDQFEGMESWAACDLSTKLDLTSVARGFRRYLPDGKPLEGGRRELREHVYLFGRHYLPEETATDPAKHHYHGWRHDGHLVVTDGSAIDYERVKADLLAAATSYPTVLLGYDPWGATQLAQELERAGLRVIEIPQNTQQLSDAMKWMEALVKDGRLHHDGDPVLTWAVSNVVAKEDANENVFPRKESADAKIDPAVAAIMVLKLMMAEAGPATSVYEQFDEQQWRSGEEAVAAEGAGDQRAATARRSIYDQFSGEEWTR